MFGINYIKFDIMDYVLHFSNGRLKKEGKGLNFYYWGPSSTIAVIPLGGSDVSFMFKQTTKDYQTITVQGQLTYKISDPRKIANQLDFTINEQKQYKKEDYDKVNKRLINEIQNAVTSVAQELKLKEALQNVKQFESEIKEGLTTGDTVKGLGLAVVGVTVISVQPTPEMAKTLEAETREKIFQEADLALYERRNFAVEQERIIKETELNTEIAVEEKQKQIAEQKMKTKLVQQENERRLRENQMKADIENETEKQALVEMKVENERKEAETKKLMLQAMIEPYKDLDWRSLMALNQGEMDAKTNIALAFRELAENADKIGTLNITPDLLEQLTTSD